jgi:hypothetical protein
MTVALLVRNNSSGSVSWKQGSAAVSDMADDHVSVHAQRGGPRSRTLGQHRPRNGVSNRTPKVGGSCVHVRTCTADSTGMMRHTWRYPGIRGKSE